MDNGFNPIRWDCHTKGCFNKKLRPKIEVFAECFPRGIGMMDWDAVVELNDKFIVLEWKCPGGNLTDGQRRALLSFTRISGNAVFVVDGDAETMNITGYSVFWKGREGPYEAATLADLKARIRGWVEMVDGPQSNGTKATHALVAAERVDFWTGAL